MKEFKSKNVTVSLKTSSHEDLILIYIDIEKNNESINVSLFGTGLINVQIKNLELAYNYVNLNTNFNVVQFHDEPIGIECSNYAKSGILFNMLVFCTNKWIYAHDEEDGVVDGSFDIDTLAEMIHLLKQVRDFILTQEPVLKNDRIIGYKFKSE